MKEKIPKRDVPPEVRDAWRIEDYATRHKMLSRLGRKGATASGEKRAEARDIAEAQEQLNHERLLQEKERQGIPRDIVVDGDVLPNPDYWERPLDERTD